MPFLSYDLPAGGRPIVPPSTAPAAGARTRLRQLLPVGLLVAAAGAGAAVASTTGGSLSAEGRDDTGGRPSTQVGQAVSPSLVPPTLLRRSDADRPELTSAAYVLPSTGRHRAATPDAHRTAGTASTAAGKHRSDADRHHVTAHPSAHPSVATAHPTATTTATTTATATATTGAAESSKPTAEASSAATTEATTTGLLTGVVSTVTGAVGSLLGTR
ncbi:hypothetical protein P5P86_00255 [Nocardioides sp. BP30]|uniref:hypothetical protein n=1 Tax=Nocardioides sp. BP30 TaxID=3036374 RepID=UPI00246837DF|nr:hypothetical protein [Nocardioides sp. BP30]WGL52278.1 hypothetical protein P5P86_00255 [Nocardioides sp. BP30]